jgi:hypothetical protein
VTTPNDIINQALKDAGIVGIGQTAQAEDINDSFTILNQMIAVWNRKRWLIFHLLDLSVVSTGSQFYTIGTGGDIDNARPDRLEAAFYRQIVASTPPNQIDFPLQILESREDYSRIGLKQLVTVSQYIFYDAAYPLGKIYPWPILPATNYELHVIVKAQLSPFANLVQAVNLPPEYEAALRYNLAIRLRPSYQLPPDPSINALAMDALNTIRNANAQVPRLRMPQPLVRPALYNIFSDSGY